MLHLITCHGRIMPRLAELLLAFVMKLCIWFFFSAYSLESVYMMVLICWKCFYSVDTDQ